MTDAVAVQCLSEAERGASRLASRLGVPLHEIAVHQFPDGELRVTVGPVAATTILYAPLDRPNDKLIALLFAAEALRRNGARRLVLVAPYLCYMRQDAAFHAGEAISQRVIGPLLAGIVNRIVTVDAHLHRSASINAVFPGIESDNLSAMPAIAAALRTKGLDLQTIVVGPDSESSPWVSDLANRVGVAHAVARKERRSDWSVSIRFDDPQQFAGRPVLIADDIVSSGGTLIACAKALASAGATRIDAVVTHALFPDALVAEFAHAGIRSVRSTDSVLHPTNAIHLDEVLAAALRTELRVAQGRSP
jgi:ribose-phosphate pyrophosphokinase